MKTKIKVLNPGDVELTLTYTTSLKHWILINEALSNGLKGKCHGTVESFACDIDQLIEKVTGEFEAE